MCTKATSDRREYKFLCVTARLSTSNADERMLDVPPGSSSRARHPQQVVEVRMLSISAQLSSLSLDRVGGEGGATAGK